jgi:hypothetical protein
MVAQPFYQFLRYSNSTISCHGNNNLQRVRCCRTREKKIYFTDFSEDSFMHNVLELLCQASLCFKTL